MNDKEFEVIDELYFVTSYEQLKANLEMNDDGLKATLSDIVRKGWVRIYKDKAATDPIESDQFPDSLKGYYFLASKEGLLLHNSK